MHYKELPSQERLLTLFNYDPITGILTNKISRGGAKAGKACGSYSKKEKRLITSVDGGKFYVARLVWMLHYGEDPKELVIDHINRDACDNRIVNLRAVTVTVNNYNKEACDNPKLCVFHNGAYQAQVSIKGKVTYVGRFPTQSEATAASLAHMAMHKAFHKK